MEQSAQSFKLLNESIISHNSTLYRVAKVEFDNPTDPITERNIKSIALANKNTTEARRVNIADCTAVAPSLGVLRNMGFEVKLTEDNKTTFSKDIVNLKTKEIYNVFLSNGSVGLQLKSTGKPFKQFDYIHQLQYEIFKITESVITDWDI